MFCNKTVTADNQVFSAVVIASGRSDLAQMTQQNQGLLFTDPALEFELHKYISKHSLSSDVESTVLHVSVSYHYI